LPPWANIRQAEAADILEFIFATQFSAGACKWIHRIDESPCLIPGSDLTLSLHHFRSQEKKYFFQNKKAFRDCNTYQRAFVVFMHGKPLGNPV
jgi:hypothetical protein